MRVPSLAPVARGCALDGVLDGDAHPCPRVVPDQVLDSPFARLRDLMVELTEEQRLPIPRAFMRVALGMMRRSVRKRAGFSIDDVSPLDAVGASFIPALFGARAPLLAHPPCASRWAPPEALTGHEEHPHKEHEEASSDCIRGVMWWLCCGEADMYTACLPHKHLNLLSRALGSSAGQVAPSATCSRSCPANDDSKCVQRCPSMP